MWHSVNGWFLLLADPTVEPTLRPGLSDRDVAPGLLGFVVTFAVVIAVIGLMISLSRRVRRVNHAQNATHTVHGTINTGPAPVDSSVLKPQEGSSEPEPTEEPSQRDPNGDDSTHEP